VPANVVERLLNHPEQRAFQGTRQPLRRPRHPPKPAARKTSTPSSLPSSAPSTGRPPLMRRPSSKKATR
jgi:hypothetical protein